MGATRADKLYKLALEAYHSGDEHPLLRALAVMVAEATKRAGPKKVDAPKLLVSPQEVHRRLSEECSDYLALDTYQKQSFARLGRIMGEITPPVEPDDIDKLIDWIQGGGIDFWTMRPTWNHVVKHFGAWLSQARDLAGPADDRPRESRVR